MQIIYFLTQAFLLVNVALLYLIALQFQKSNRPMLSQFILYFMAIERVGFYLRSIKNSINVKEYLLNFILNILYLDWKRNGIKNQHERFSYTNYYINVKKQAQFLNSIPIALVFYYLTSIDHNEQISLIFIIYTFYSMTLVAFLITLRQIQRNTQTKVESLLYFFIQAGSLVSLWALFGQIVYFQKFFMGIILLIKCFDLIYQFHFRARQNWILDNFKQLFMIKQLDSISYFNLTQIKAHEIYVSFINFAIYFILFFAKLNKYNFINNYDLFIYMGCLFKLVDLTYLLRILYHVQIIQKQEYNVEIDFEDQAIKEQCEIISQKNKNMKQITIQINLKDKSPQAINQNQLDSIYKLIESTKVQMLIIINSNWNIEISYKNKGQVIIIGPPQKQYDNHALNFALKFTSSYNRDLIQEIDFKTYFHYTKKEIFTATQLIMSLMENPLQKSFKINQISNDLINSYNKFLIQSVFSAVVLEKDAFPEININPQLILYDLLDN